MNYITSYNKGMGNGMKENVAMIIFCYVSDRLIYLLGVRVKRLRLRGAINSS